MESNQSKIIGYLLEFGGGHSNDIASKLGIEPITAQKILSKLRGKDHVLDLSKKGVYLIKPGAEDKLRAYLSQG